jgi:hypothetical protein
MGLVLEEEVVGWGSREGLVVPLLLAVEEIPVAGGAVWWLPPLPDGRGEITFVALPAAVWYEGCVVGDTTSALPPAAGGEQQWRW